LIYSGKSSKKELKSHIFESFLTLTQDRAPRLRHFPEDLREKSLKDGLKSQIFGTLLDGHLTFWTFWQNLEPFPMYNPSPGKGANACTQLKAFSRATRTPFKNF
jgi:hypothetical protein